MMLNRTGTAIALFLCLCGVFMGSVSTYAATDGSPTPALHITGRFLQNPHGRTVNLHGWWQAIDSYFNGQAYTDPKDWQSPSQVAPVLTFFNATADILTHRSPLYGAKHGWACTFVRLTGYRCPGWDYHTGQLTDSAQFTSYLHNFIVPYVAHCRHEGLYVVLVGNPTGQDQGANYGDNSRNMTQAYQKSLLQFWQIVASTPGIKNADNVQFELCNEPDGIETHFGAGDWGNGNDAHWAALAQFMQPIVNMIRQQGAKNVVWVPSLADQQQNMGFVRHPVHGVNIGYAAHIYPGYVRGATGGGDPNITQSVNNLWNYEYKPCADRYPMLITESWWNSLTAQQVQKTPYLSLFNGITGSATYGYGMALKHLCDSAGNVGYLIGTPADLLQNLGSGPGHATLSNADGARAAFDWFPLYGVHSHTSL